MCSGWVQRTLLQPKALLQDDKATRETSPALRRQQCDSTIGGDNPDRRSITQCLPSLAVCVWHSPLQRLLLRPNQYPGPFEPLDCRLAKTASMHGEPFQHLQSCQPFDESFFAQSLTGQAVSFQLISRAVLLRRRKLRRGASLNMRIGTHCLMQLMPFEC